MQEDYFLGSLYAKERISFVDNYVKASKELENNPYYWSQEAYGPQEGVLDQIKPDSFESNFKEDLHASWRQFSEIFAIKRLIEQNGIEDDPTYDPYKDSQLDAFPTYRWRFHNSGSQAETALRIERFQQDLEDVETLASSTRFMPQAIASLASPLTFAPLAPLRVMRYGSNLSRFTGGAGFTMLMHTPAELLVHNMNEARTDMETLLILGGAGIIGGSFTAAFGKNLGRRSTLFDREPEPQLLEGPNKVGPGVGANINPDSPLYRRSMYDAMDNDAFIEIGGLEKLPWNPVLRMAQSPNPVVRTLFAKMVDVGGMIQKKVLGEQAMDQSVEATFRTKYIGGLVTSLRRMDFEYISYRGLQPKKGEIGLSMQKMKLQAKDKLGGGDGKISDYEFRIRVTKAIRNGGQDIIEDEATPFINRAAREAKKHFDLIKKEGQSVRIFEKEVKGVLKVLRDKLNRATDDDTKARLRGEIEIASERLAEIQARGPSINTAKGYVTRIPRIDVLMERQEDFVRIVASWARGQYGITPEQARSFAKEVHDTYTRSRPFFDIDEGMSQIDWIKNPASVKARSFSIPDELIEEFLENDIETIMRHYTKTMGTDIELMRTFGSIDMSDIIKSVQDEYAKLISEATTTKRKTELRRRMELDIKDIRGLRDRLRGTYGASKDPHQTSSRVVRAMKSFNVLVGMGSAVVSSVPDVFRTVMVEGFTTTYQKGWSKWFNDIGDIASKLKARELRAAGIGGDASLGLRSHAYADIGDTFGNRFGFERKLYQGTNLFFMLNGLNYWNQMMKEFAGSVTMLRMTDAIMTPWNRLSTGSKEKLLKNGIGQQDHAQMQQLIRTHGQKIDNEWFPNTDFWTNMTQRQKFRNALNMNVERTIITPGAGDRALWTSTEFGSLITQFRGFGQGAMIRMLNAGLQEREGAFWQGAFLLVGLAALVNEFKRKQYGLDDRPESFNEKMVNAVDRSGVLGWFADVNNAVEKVTDFKLGMRPFLTDRPEFEMPFGAKIGSLFGPAAQNLNNAVGITSDILTGTANAKTLESSRFIFPGGNLPYLDPILDGVFNPNVNSKSN